VAAVVVLLVWGVFELRIDQPLVDLRTTARRQVLVTNLASVALGFGMFAMSLVLPQLLQLPAATGYGLGKSLLTAGLVMAPSGLVMMATAPVSAAISRAKGPKVTLMIGALIVAAGYGINIALMDQVWHFVLVSCVIGCGIGFTYGAMPALIMGAVPASETGAANSLNTLMRSIGTSTASAVAGVILANMTTTLGPVTLPSENGFKTVLATGAGAALLAFAVASFIPRRGPAGGAASPAGAAGEQESRGRCPGPRRNAPHPSPGSAARLLQGRAQMPSVLREQSLRRGPVDTAQDGQDRVLHLTVRGRQGPLDLLVRRARRQRHDAAGAGAQLVVGGPHVDHQVPVRLAQADHRDR
jgi:MFS family permease